MEKDEKEWNRGQTETRSLVERKNFSPLADWPVQCSVEEDRKTEPIFKLSAPQ